MATTQSQIHQVLSHQDLQQQMLYLMGLLILIYRYRNCLVCPFARAICKYYYFNVQIILNYKCLTHQKLSQIQSYSLQVLKFKSTQISLLLVVQPKIQQLDPKMLNRFMTRISAALFIQTKKTPNPDFLQFLPQSHIVMGANDSVDIPDEETAIKTSNLARKLFKVQGIKRVFLGPNYISVGKTEKSNWNQLKPMIFDLIQNHFQSGQPIIRDPKSNDEGFDPSDSETVKLIKQILWSRVRPTVQDDGGDIKYISFDDKTGILTIAMLGSCAGCPSSSATLKNGIFKMMKHYVGEVKDVVAQDFKPK